MSDNPFFLISLLLSPVIAFSSVALLVTLLLSFLKRYSRFKGGRFFAAMRSLPFISLTIDLLANTLSIGALLNPLNCASCVQKVILTLFFPELKEQLAAHQISLWRYLGEDIADPVFRYIGMALLGFSLLLISKKIAETLSTSRKLKQISARASVCTHALASTALAEILQKDKVKILISDEIDIPLAAPGRTIFIPQWIYDSLPPDELTAIVAHEYEHIRWKDSCTRLFSQLVSSLFWWVPSASWRQTMELEQEMACDQAMQRYGIPPTSLATALLKVTEGLSDNSSPMLCYLAQKRHPSLRRLENMLGQDFARSRRREWTSFCIIMAASLMITVCALL